MEVYPPPMPYQVCKIEELRKVGGSSVSVLLWTNLFHQNPKGSVEVAAKCFYRRKDLPPNLLSVADRHACKLGLVHNVTFNPLMTSHSGSGGGEWDGISQWWPQWPQEANRFAQTPSSSQRTVPVQTGGDTQNWYGQVCVISSLSTWKV